MATTTGPGADSEISSLSSNNSRPQTPDNNFAGQHAPSHTVPVAPSSEPSNSSSRPSITIPKVPVNDYHSRPSWWISWWWWWELGAVLLSMTAMFSIIILLAIWSDASLSDWKFSIQINSLIATLTTLGKTAMLVAVTESISQLKWLHFYKQPRQLIRFQDFDDASRGPWGSLMLLWASKGMAVLASLGAIITILGLAIEPMAQQIVEFPSRNVSRDQDATLGTARFFQSASVVQGAVRGYTVTTSNLLQLQSSLMNGVVGRVAEPQFHCPDDAASCEWPAFSTLGLCAAYKNITDYDRACHRYDDTDTINCDYTGADISGVKDDRPLNPFDLNLSGSDDDYDYSSILRMWYDPDSVTNGNQSMIFASFFTENGITTIKTKGPVERGQYKPTTAPAVDIERVTWDWCERNYSKVVASPRAILEQPYTFEYLTFDQDSNVPDEVVGDGYYAYVANSSGTAYGIAFPTRDGIMEWFWGFLNTTQWTETIHTPSKATDHFDLAQHLMNNKLDVIATDLSDAFTHQMRANSSQVGGDNVNVTLIPGTVYVTETYIKVRWPWIILPLLETVLAALLLISSMLISSGRPLFKSSAIAPLIHGLEGWTENELYIPPVHESKGNIERLASAMTTSLDVNEVGHLKLLRHATQAS